MPERPQDPKDWIRQNIVDETHRRIKEQVGPRTERRHCADPRAWRVAIAFGVIGLGVLLFLSNVGILPAFNYWDLWPVFPMAAGVGRLSSPRPGTRLAGFALIAIGGGILATNMGWIHFHFRDDSWILSLILIGIGFIALFNVFDPMRAAASGMARANQFWKTRAADGGSTLLGDFAVLGTVKRKVEGPDFRGGELTAFMGNIDIDLRRASITSPDKAAVLNTNAIMSSIKIRVPDHWRVHLRGMSVLGNFEDKTLPPNTGDAAPMLIVGGWSFLGSVEIED